MRPFALLPFCLALSGCVVSLHGHQSTRGGATTTTSAATRAQASAGSARVGASFGTPAPHGAAGGRVAFSRGASAVIVLGLVVAETVNYLSAKLSGTPQAAASAPLRSIADTCSCYGYQPSSEDARVSTMGRSTPDPTQVASDPPPISITDH